MSKSESEIPDFPALQDRERELKTLINSAVRTNLILSIAIIVCMILGFLLTYDFPEQYFFYMNVLIIISFICGTFLGIMVMNALRLSILEKELNHVYD